MVLIREREIGPIKPKKKILLLTTCLGMLLIVLSVVSIIVDPVYVLIKYGSRIKNNSYLFELFQRELEGAKISLTIFNVTNAEKFMRGEDYKLKVEEVGPFTYVEIRRNIEVELDEDAELLRYTPKLKIMFLPDESVGYPEDVSVTVPNIAMLSATSLLSSYPYLIRSGFRIFVNQFNSKAIINTDAQSYMWGYKDPIISFANTMVPGLINFDKLGIMDRLFDNNTKYRLEVSLKESEKYSIKTLQKYLTNRVWDNDSPVESYTFQNTYEGAGYPLDMRINTPLKIFRIGVCRVFDLEFFEKRTLNLGPEGWAYKLANSTFNKDCEKSVCGILDLGPCIYGVPLGLSRTHFLYADPSIYERIDGIRPDPKKHDSEFVLEPRMGLEMETTLSLQMNLVVKDVGFIGEASKFSNMVLPVAYIHVTQPKLLDEIKDIVRMVLVNITKIVLAIEIAFIVVGVVLLIYSLRSIYSNGIYSSDKTPLKLQTNRKEAVSFISDRKI